MHHFNYDAETGYHYNWYRTYNPHTGRYLTADPIELYGGINLYTYVNGNPISYVDSKGLKKYYPISDAEGYREWEDSKVDCNYCKLKCQIRYDSDPMIDFWFDEMEKSGGELGYCAYSDSPNVCEAIVTANFFKAEYVAKRRLNKCLDGCKKVCEDNNCKP